MSPVRSRGANQDVPIPYITPSLRDYPVADDMQNRLDNGANLAPPDPSSGIKREITWSPKYDTQLEGSLWAPGCSAVTSSDPISDAFCRGRRTGHSFVPAPWRSLVYRNVDTPFPYFDDYVPFPHMPMNTAGFDCRAPRIMGDWMVSIPAILKAQYQGISEDVIPHNRRPRDWNLPARLHRRAPAVPGGQARRHPIRGGAGRCARRASPSITAAYATTTARTCWGTTSSTMLDPSRFVKYNDPAKARPDRLLPDPNRVSSRRHSAIDPLKPGYYVQPAMGIPYHAEWFDYDPTDASPWAPRRSNWPTVLKSGIPDSSLPSGQINLDHGDDRCPAAADRSPANGQPHRRPAEVRHHFAAVRPLAAEARVRSQARECACYARDEREEGVGLHRRQPAGLAGQGQPGAFAGRFRLHDGAGRGPLSAHLHQLPWSQGRRSWSSERRARGLLRGAGAAGQFRCRAVRPAGQPGRQHGVRVRHRHAQQPGRRGEVGVALHALDDPGWNVATHSSGRDQPGPGDDDPRCSGGKI